MKNLTIPNRPIIIVFSHYYMPGFKSGGPVRSIANIVDELGDEFDFRVVTLGWDFMDEHPYKQAALNSWETIGKAKVWYFGGKWKDAFSLARALFALDNSSLYLNSLFDPAFSLLPLLAIKTRMLKAKRIIIAPRGELSSGALDLKPWKKNLFLSAVKLLGLYKKVVWHASTSFEKQDIERVFAPIKNLNIQIAADLPGLKPFLSTTKKGSPLFFLSRITRKKNLDFALRAVSMCKSQVNFHIYGTLEDRAYWKECQTLIDAMPKNVCVEYKGTLTPEEVIPTIKEYSLFFFPTRGENYGHVIAESLAAGVPVLLSDQTPWSNIEDENAGWIRSLDSTKNFADVIDSFINLDSQGYEKLREGVYRYACVHLNSKVDIDRNRKLFAAH